MTMYIGENIKRLRRAKNITQEKLASHLNVSTQAVSKWERNETYPDITMILPLSTYFDVSCDELLGLNKAKNEIKINELIDEYIRLNNLGKVKEGFQLICDAYAEFPNDFRIIDKYVMALSNDPHSYQYKGYLDHEEEIVELCNRILDYCNIDEYRYHAMSTLGGIYSSKNEYDKALEYAERFPSRTYSELQCEHCFDKGTEKWWYWVRNNIGDLADYLADRIHNCALFSETSPNEKIKLFQKAIDLINIIYDEGDYGFSYWHLSELHLWLSNQYITLKDWSKAKKFLELSFEYIKKYDDMPKLYKHTSFLVQGNILDTSKIFSGYEGNAVDFVIKTLESDNFYNEVRNCEWFQYVIEKYKNYAC